MASKSKKQNGLLETTKTIVYALLLAGLIRTLLFQPFYIPSSSMKSTLLIGDFLFVNKYAYGYSYASCPTVFGVDFCGFAKGSGKRIMGSEPEVGDVVVFKHPVTGQDYIKRLIGKPGDRIQIIDGVIFINGVEAKQTPTENFTETYAKQGPEQSFPRCLNQTPAIGGACEKQAFIETLPNGEQHTILNIGNQRTDNTDVYVVPEGHFFFMGDNRDNSTDSRVAQRARGVGFVPYENIIGRADRIIFSSSGSSLLMFWQWRSDRYFKAID